MATWQVIERVGETLVRILTDQFAQLIPGNNILIQVATASNFEAYVDLGQPAITIFLYKIIPNGETRNVARRSVSGNTYPQPLPLELYYIVTPWSSRANQTAVVDVAATREEHKLLGGILQSFHDHAEVARSELVDNGAPVWSDVDTLQIVLESPATEDLFRIWDSTEHAYRTSLTYCVRVVGMESNEAVGSSPVVEAVWRSGSP